MRTKKAGIQQKIVQCVRGGVKMKRTYLNAIANKEAAVSM
jgi:hypothetical protein